MNMTESNKNKLLDFPIQLVELKDSTSDEQYAQQTRIAIANILNSVADGRYTLTDRDRKNIRSFNKAAIRCGYKPIETDLEKL